MINNSAFRYISKTSEDTRKTLKVSIEVLFLSLLFLQGVRFIECLNQILSFIISDIFMKREDK